MTARDGATNLRTTMSTASHYGPLPESSLMTDQSENLILEYLRAMRSDMAGIKERVAELFVRTVSIEGYLARIDSRLAHFGGGEAFRTYARLDALEARIDRLERRLELAP